MFSNIIVLFSIYYVLVGCRVRIYRGLGGYPPPPSSPDHSIVTPNPQPLSSCCVADPPSSFFTIRTLVGWMGRDLWTRIGFKVFKSIYLIFLLYCLLLMSQLNIINLICTWVRHTWALFLLTFCTRLFHEVLLIWFDCLCAINKFELNWIEGTKFSPHVKNQDGGKNTLEENLQYLENLKSDFEKIFTVSSQIKLAYNPMKLFELPRWTTS